MKKLFGIYMVMWLTISAHSATSSTHTNDSNAIASPAFTHIEELLRAVPDDGESWWMWFKYHTIKNGSENRNRQFGPLSRFNWINAELGDGREIFDRTESKGTSVFADTLTESVFDSFADWFDFNRFKQKERPGITFGAKLAEGTMNTREGRMRPSSVELEDAASMHEWINSFIVDNSSQYGFNLLRYNPYGYYSVAIWNKKNGLPLVISTTRFKMMLGELQPDRPKLEEELIFPFDRLTQGSCGYELYPTVFGERDLKPAYTVKFSRQLDRKKINGNILYASARFEEHENMFRVGLSFNHFPWK